MLTPRTLLAIFWQSAGRSEKAEAAWGRADGAGAQTPPTSLVSSCQRGVTAGVPRPLGVERMSAGIRKPHSASGSCGVKEEMTTAHSTPGGGRMAAAARRPRLASGSGLRPLGKGERPRRHTGARLTEEALWAGSAWEYCCISGVISRTRKRHIEAAERGMEIATFNLGVLHSQCNDISAARQAFERASASTADPELSARARDALAELEGSSTRGLATRRSRRHSIRDEVGPAGVVIQRGEKPVPHRHPPATSHPFSDGP